MENLRKLFIDIRRERVGKRILLITNELSNSGAPHALLDIAKILNRLGYYVVVASKRDGEFREYFEGVGAYVVIIHNWRIKLNMWLFSRFDLVFCNTALNAPIARFFQRWTSIPTCLWIHESAFFDSEYMKGSRGSIVMKALTKTRNVYCVSEYARSFVARVNKNSQIFSFGIEDRFNEFPDSRVPEDNNVVFICVANIIEVKGYDTLLSAFRSLPAEYQFRYTLNIVGCDSEPELAVRLMDSYQDMPNIHFLGALPHAQTLAKLKNSDVFVLASHGDSVSISTIEALMMDKPVIISNFTGVSSIVEGSDAGYVFDIDCPEQLVDYIKLLINNPRSKGHPRQLFLDQFSFDEYSIRVEEWISSMISQRR